MFRFEHDLINCDAGLLNPWVSRENGGHKTIQIFERCAESLLKSPYCPAELLYRAGDVGCNHKDGEVYFSSAAICSPSSPASLTERFASVRRFSKWRRLAIKPLKQLDRKSVV